MKLSTNNFTTAIKQIIVGGESAVSGAVAADSGFLKDGDNHVTDATVAAGTTDIPVKALVVPRDYDEAADVLSIEIQGRSAGATDTPTLTITATRTRVGVADSVLASSVLVGTFSASQQKINVALSGNGLKRGDVIEIVATSGAHTTDALERLSAVPTYRSTLVSWKAFDGNTPLR